MEGRETEATTAEEEEEESHTVEETNVVGEEDHQPKPSP